MISKLKVIDASTVLAGPSVATFFAELGAKVTKIENPLIPDVTRTWKLATEDEFSEVSAYFSSVNYKKSYLKLNLRSPEGQKEFLKQVKTADILVTNFKKGDADKFGIGDDVLQNLNPRLIHGKISGYGPDSSRVAYDLILQAETGFMSMNGAANGLPVKMPVALIDVLAAHQLKEGILLALLEREQTQKGKTVQVSLYDTAVCSLVNQASNYLMEAKIPKRMGSLHPNIAPYGEIFKTADDQLITFAIGSDGHFIKLCHYLGIEYLPDDAKFMNNQKRVENRAELAQILQDEIEKIDADEILEWANEYFVPCGKIRDLRQVFEDERARSFIREEEIDGKLTRRVSTIAFE
ncbi:MAG: Formyl-CoA transferase [Crocinitomicaceae bacterium]|jgi:crotonobetainyl-CoA:carnitine CoA-transferase CaiB-like acyl-CoA transferase|nr:Formyl-CoA transferase [Crocinitomicaceae bacterium]